MKGHVGFKRTLFPSTNTHNLAFSPIGRLVESDRITEPMMMVFAKAGSFNDVSSDLVHVLANGARFDGVNDGEQSFDSDIG